MFREMMLFHLGGARELDPRIRGAREIVQWFMACQAGLGESGLLPAQVKSIMERRQERLYHDELGEVYDPVYFQEFLAHAARFGLQFLAEASYFDMRSEEHTSELQSLRHLVCRLLLEKKKQK